MKKEQKRLKYILRQVLAKAAELGVTSTSTTATTTASTHLQQDSNEVDRARIQALTDAVEVLTNENQQLKEHVRMILFQFF